MENTRQLKMNNGSRLHKQPPEELNVVYVVNYTTQLNAVCTCVFLPVLWKTPGLQWQYLCAKASIILSIFWASPGKRKLQRNCLCKSKKICFIKYVYVHFLPSSFYLINLPESLDEVQISKLVQVNKGLKNFDVEIIPKGQ